VAEAAQKSASEIYNRIMVTHLLRDASDKNRIAGAAGFSVRDGTFYVFRAKAVIVSAGGATHVYRPKSVGEGAGRTWYAPWSTGSAYALLIRVGATDDSDGEPGLWLQGSRMGMVLSEPGS